MKLGIMVLGLFIMIGLFLFVWYHVERMQDELEQIDRMQKKDEI